MSSLQDQLLKAGLVDTKKAKKVSKEKRKNTKVQHKSKEIVVDEAKVAAQVTRSEKVARDKKLNEAQKAQADKKAIAAQIKQLIEQNSVPKDGGFNEVVYNFTDGKQIKQIRVSPIIQRQLERGQLAIAKIGDRYELLPAVVADKINQRDEVQNYVVSQQTTQAEVDEDDPYADYQIPDDLMW